MKIAVAVTSFDQEHFLGEALDSVLAQTRRPDEVLVVDDASRDGSRALIEAWAARHPGIVRPLWHERNLGAAASRNDALMAATADVITFLDGDDRFLSRKLEREAAALAAAPNAKIAYSNFRRVDAAGVPLWTWAEREPPPQGDVFARAFARQFPRGTLFRNEMVETRTWREFGVFDTRLALYEDYDARIRLAKRFRTTYVDEPLAEYRQHAKALSQAPACDHLRAVEYVYRKNRGLLGDLDPLDRSNVERALAGWMADLAWGGARRELRAARGARLPGALLRAATYFLRALRYRAAGPGG